LVVLAAMVLAIWALKATVFRAQPLEVTVYPVARGTVESTVVNSRAGTVLSRRDASLSPGVGGLVRALPVHKGDTVHAGDLLLAIDDAEYRAQVTLAERSLDAAKAAEKEARLQTRQRRRALERNRKLSAEGFVSKELLEELQTAEEVADASAKAATENARRARAALAQARATEAKTRLTAPFDGVITEVSAELGEWVSPSAPGLPMPPVLRLVDLNHLYLRAPLDEVDAAAVRVGLPVRITLDAFPGHSFPGRLTWTSPVVETVERQNRTMTVEAEFDSSAAPAGVLPGLSTDLEVILRTRENVLRLPTNAILEGNRVLVVKENRLRSVALRPGLRNWQYTEVLEGPGAGDRVVTSLDRDGVRAGARVVVAGEAGS